MPNIISRQDAEALIQEQIVGTISQEAPQHSTFMQLARRLPNMTSRQTRIPVLDMLPMAYWVNGDTGFKQTSMQKWENVFLTAEELAVIVPIPEAVLDDASFDILGEVQPRVMEAIGQCVDSARRAGRWTSFPAHGRQATTLRPVRARTTTTRSWAKTVSSRRLKPPAAWSRARYPVWASAQSCAV